MSSEYNKIPDFTKMITGLKRDLVTYAAVTALNFFKDSFTNQGFTDQSFKAWEKRKGDIDAGRAILIKSSYLRDSLEVISQNEKRIVFGSDSPQAAIHNEGGVITINVTITPKMRKFFWAMFKKTEDAKWKWMALTKKEKLSFKVNMPKRQFIGESITLMRDLDEWFIKELKMRVAKLKSN